MKTLIFSLLLTGSAFAGLTQNIQEALPQTPITSASKTHISMDDLISIKFKNGKTAFISKDHRYLVLGAIIDLKSGKIENNGATHA